MTTRTGYVTTVALANGDRYEVKGRPEEVLLEFEEARSRFQEFWNVDFDIYVRVSDVSSLRGRQFEAEIVEHKPVYEQLKVPGKLITKSVGFPTCSCGDENCQLYTLERG